MLAPGLLFLAIGFTLRTGVVARISDGLCLSILTALFAVAAGEVFCRVVGFDFSREEEAWRKTPPFFRQPTVPIGSVFFRRPGPEQWTGQVLNTQIEKLRLSPNPYRDDPVVTICYDRLGFRNEAGLTDWEIVVAGDSFTELGHLPYDQLFTTVLGKLRNTRVLNLSASYTGPLTQLSYLQEYGVSPATRCAVIVFFEGNDLQDLANEWTLLSRYRETGQRPYREFTKRTSLLKAVYHEVFALRDRQSAASEPLVTAQFKSRSGDCPVTLKYAPPNREQMPLEAMNQLEYFFEHYAAFGKARGLELWLAYMPCKERVLSGRIEFSARAPEKLKGWRPSDLPQVITEMAVRHGVQFLDLTPALVQETAATGELLFNSIYDTHLNAHGARVVAAELARRLPQRE